MTSSFVPHVSLSAPDDVSIYETLRRDEDAGRSKAESNEFAGDNEIDDVNFGERFEDDDIDQLLANNIESHTRTDSITQTGSSRAHDLQPSSLPVGPAVGYDQEHHDREEPVPESLLFEAQQPQPQHSKTRSAYYRDASVLPDPVPGPAPVQFQSGHHNRHRRMQHHSNGLTMPVYTRSTLVDNALLAADPVEKAMWRWINVENLDLFLHDVYEYFLQRGIWSIILSRALQQLITAFVVSLAIVLTMCIDYQKLAGSKKLPDILVSQCTTHMPTSLNALIWLFTFWWVFKSFWYLLDVRRLWHLHSFYEHLLGVPDEDMQTVTWQEIVGRLMNLRDANPRTALNIEAHNIDFLGTPEKQRMDAHDIANRLMRKENYLIALFNKDVLDLTLPVPLLRSRQLFSKTLEWYVGLCITDFVFSADGQVRQLFLKDARRRDLIRALERRFKFYALGSIVCAPFLAAYYLAMYFLRYFIEFQKNPAQLGSRSYTPLAEWKFREFNELHHLFRRRRDMSIPFASHYINQFPKDKTEQLASFVAFIAGALAAVLGLASLFDPDLFLGFELSPDRTVLFYLGIFGSTWALCRGIILDEALVYDPMYAMEEVIHFTHYQPFHWRDRLNSEEVRRDFSKLFQMKVLVFLEEIFSMLFTPLVLWYSLPQCSERIVDFFREFTIHVDGLGYVCSFAVFDFQRTGFGNTGAPLATTTPPERQGAQNQGVDHEAYGPRQDYYSTKDGKMMASYYGFMKNYAPKSRQIRDEITRQNPFDFPPVSSTQPVNTSMLRGIESGAPRSSIQKGGKRLDRRQQLMKAYDRVESSPSASLLLDVHHQRHSARIQTTKSSKRNTNRRDMISEGLGELMPEDAGPSAEPVAVQASRPPEKSDVLSSSWNMSRAVDAGRSSTIAPATDEREGPDSDGSTGGGVLGLLYEFQRGRTAARGPGVNI
ncbi:MAG: autophagy protein atg9 [Chrysothrix sp. TS-e1954]|nr:MAG: autophagy protein atg9 [Chrysothrix sp. TS-e1954]